MAMKITAEMRRTIIAETGSDKSQLSLVNGIPVPVKVGSQVETKAKETRNQQSVKGTHLEVS